jgi:hypothetical protein
MVMLKKIALTVILFVASAAALAATPAEKKAEALKEAQALVAKYGSTSNPATLQKLDGYIERTWSRYTNYYGTTPPLAADIALLRARSTSAAGRSKYVAVNWQTAIRLLPISTSGERRLDYFTQAATASTRAKDYQAAQQFYAAARSYAIVRGKNANTTKLYLRLQELKSVDEKLDWRRLNDSLLDMRKYSEGFTMWSIPRLDALLGEAEIRLAMQPQKDPDKREVLGDLKAQILLVQKGMNGAVLPTQLERIRTLFYALEDYFGL